MNDKFVITCEDEAVEVPKFRAICSSILEECFEIVEEIKIRSDEVEVSHAFKPIYDRLRAASEPEGLLLTHDLWNYTRSLQELDETRVEGNFVDSDGNMPSGQYVSRYSVLVLPQWLIDSDVKVLLSFLRRCYGISYMLLSSREPISEELTPIVSIHKIIILSSSS